MKTFKFKGKKALSVFLSVVMIFTSCITVSPAFAAEGESTCTSYQDGNHQFSALRTVEKTCTEDGYTLMACACGAEYKTDIKKAEGHTWKDYHKDPTCLEDGGTGIKCEVCGEVDFYKEQLEALGHDMSQWYFKPVNGAEYYYHTRNCGRDGCGYTEFEYEEGSETQKAVYYKVDFVNEWRAKKFFTAADGTKLAYDEFNEDNYESSTSTIYVKSGNAATYEGSTPTRHKTTAFGAYQFKGWDIADELKSVTKNLTAKAQFEGVKVTYNVSFNGYQSTRPNDGEMIQYTYVHIAHGEKIQFNPARYCIPQHPDQKSLYYRYTFNGWDFKYCPDVEKPLVEDETKDYVYGDAVTTVPIYSNHQINAKYESTPKKYKVVFHDEYGNVMYNGDENGVVFEYGTRPSFVPVITLINSVEADKDPNDFYNCKKYSYNFGNLGFKEARWKDKNGKAVDIDALSVPYNTVEYDPELESNEFLEDEDKGIIHLYPNIVTISKVYTMNLIVMDIDGETPAEGATVTITDIAADDGATHLVGSPYTLDEHGFTEIKLPYNESAGGQLGIGVYNINVVLDGRKAIGVITDAHFDEIFAGKTPTIELKLLEAEGDEADKGCTCICHSFLGNLYITFLNLAYRLFGIKIVCCYDMYARHGDKLVYTK